MSSTHDDFENRMERRFKSWWARGLMIRIPMIVGGVLIGAGLAFLFGLVVMALWNWVMPAIFGLPEISYWQGWALVVLAHILFKAGSGAGESAGKKVRREVSREVRGEVEKAIRQEVAEAIRREMDSRRGETTEETPGGEDEPPAS
jgi:hypothetical protein